MFGFLNSSLGFGTKEVQAASGTCASHRFRARPPKNSEYRVTDSGAVRTGGGVALTPFLALVFGPPRSGSSNEGS